jgi:hypothetical protein
VLPAIIAGMDSTPSARELIGRLSADEIRRRIADLVAEQRALRVLLRSAEARDRRRMQPEASR